MSFDSRSFRDALGLFVTGVTIITTISEEGKATGVTANSFNSVSMSPPLILWSLGKASHSIDAFLTAGHFCVHILREDQESLARRFATSGIDKFADLETEEGTGGVPMLPECAARLMCRTYSQHTGGDHIVFLGEVLRLKTDVDARPLLYHGGKYASLVDSDLGTLS